MKQSKPQENWKIMLEAAFIFVTLHPEGDIEAIIRKVNKNITQLLADEKERWLANVLPITYSKKQLWQAIQKYKREELPDADKDGENFEYYAALVCFYNWLATEEFKNEKTK